MNLLPTEHSEDGELFEITAMVDVVFILLAFFVLSVAFEQVERDVIVGYGDATVPAGASVADLPAQVIVRLWLGDQGEVRMAVGDRLLPDDGYDQITALLTYMDAPQIRVVISASGDVSVQQVAHALDAVLASPMKNVTLTRLHDTGAHHG